MTLNFILAALATWRLTSLLSVQNNEGGPFDIFTRLRAVLNIRYHEVTKCKETAKTFIGKTLCCFWCTSIWVGMGVTTLLLVDNRISGVREVLLYPLALSTAAILLDRIERG